MATKKKRFTREELETMSHEDLIAIVEYLQGGRSVDGLRLRSTLADLYRAMGIQADHSHYAKDTEILRNFLCPPMGMRGYTVEEIAGCVKYLIRQGVAVQSLGVLNTKGLLAAYVDGVVGGDAHERARWSNLVAVLNGEKPQWNGNGKTGVTTNGTHHNGTKAQPVKAVAVKDWEKLVDELFG